MREDDRRLLPSMAALQTFEAAARYASFSRAAHALGLTQSAVSRQIANLEEWLGAPLFERSGRRVALNETGRAYLDEIAPALAAIRRATGRLLAPAPEGAIELASLPGFGMRWLAPRLPRFTAQHPELVVNIAARIDLFDFATESFDAAIHVGPPDWPGVAHDLLFREHVAPVMSPALVTQHRVHAPADLLRVPLLVQSQRRDAWHRWFALSGITLPAQQPLPSIAHFLMLAQAVRAGAGAAMLPTFLIEPELAAGELVIPLHLPLSEDRSYYLVYPPERLRRPGFARFRDWIVAEASAGQMPE